MTPVTGDRPGTLPYLPSCCTLMGIMPHACHDVLRVFCHPPPQIIFNLHTFSPANLPPAPPPWETNSLQAAEDRKSSQMVPVLAFLGPIASSRNRMALMEVLRAQCPPGAPAVEGFAHRLSLGLCLVRKVPRFWGRTWIRGVLRPSVWHGKVCDVRMGS